MTPTVDVTISKIKVGAIFNMHTTPFLKTAFIQFKETQLNDIYHIVLKQFGYKVVQCVLPFACLFYKAL